MSKYKLPYPQYRCPSVYDCLPELSFEVGAAWRSGSFWVSSCHSLNELTDDAEPYSDGLEDYTK